MGKVILIIVIGCVIAGLWARSALAEKRRQKNEPTELNKHPERLEQNLDSSDDA